MTPDTQGFFSPDAEFVPHEILIEDSCEAICGQCASFLAKYLIRYFPEGKHYWRIEHGYAYTNCPNNGKTWEVPFAS